MQSEVVYGDERVTQDTQFPINVLLPSVISNKMQNHEGKTTDKKKYYTKTKQHCVQLNATSAGSLFLCSPDFSTQ